MWNLDPSFQQDGAHMLHLPYTWESAEKELKERERKERNGREGKESVKLSDTDCDSMQLHIDL